MIVRSTTPTHAQALLGALRRAVALVAAALCAACTSEGQGLAESGIPIRLVPAYSDSVFEYALLEASTSLPMLASVEALGLTGQFTDVRIGNGKSVVLPRLAADVSFEMQLVGTDGSTRQIRVRALPADFPPYSIERTGPVADGKIYTGVFTGFTSQSYSYSLILNGDGAPFYFRRFANPTFNFHKVVYPDGRVRYAYLDSAVGFEPGLGAARGDIVLLDERFRELRRFRLAATGTHGPLLTENHDVLVFDDDHWVLSSYDERTVDLSAFGGRPDSHVVASVLQEIRDGEVTWEWDSTQYPQLYGASVEGNDYTNSRVAVADYMHFNSIEVDPYDGGYIVSFRHLDAIIKIMPNDVPRGSPIPIKWVLGGRLDQFGLTASQKFYHQHDARIVSRAGSTLTLSLFNNNNGHYNEHASSAMVFALDEDTKSARLVDEYPGFFSAAQGSVQVLESGHYSICWGADNRITEALAGTRVFTLDFDDKFLVYRARKLR